MILTCGEMREAEERVFAAGVEAEELMDKAGAGIAKAVMQFFPHPGPASSATARDTTVETRWSPRGISRRPDGGSSSSSSRNAEN